MRFPTLTAVILLGATTLGPALAQVPSGGTERTLIVVPTGVEELTELRINTGKKARLSDGSFNTVYEKKTPGKGMAFLRFTADVAVEGAPLILRAADLRLQTGGEPPRIYVPIDWFQDLGLEEARGDSLAVVDRALLQFTIECPRKELDGLTLHVASLQIGTIAEIRERIRAHSGTK